MTSAAFLRRVAAELLILLVNLHREFAGGEQYQREPSAGAEVSLFSISMRESEMPGFFRCRFARSR